MKLLLYSFILGLCSTTILNLLDICNGVEGLEYYSEVHLSRWNSYIHSLGMPFVYYGINMWFPALFNYSVFNAWKIQLFFYILYMTHYMTINFWVGLLTAIIYFVPFLFSVIKYAQKTRCQSFLHGFIVMTIFLLIQEGFGHWVGGDEWSRLEAIPNAIMYAIFYSVRHIFY